MSRRLLRAILAAGARAGDRVALMLPNGIPFIIAEMAIIKGAMVKVPLNVRFHIDEVLYALGDCEPTILVCDSAYVDEVVKRRDQLPSLKAIFTVGGEVEGTQSYDAEIAAGEGAVSTASYREDDPILIRYTGGTTGRPKGIVHTERSFIDIHLDQLRELGHQQDDVALHLGHLSHGLNFIWATFYAVGATQILHERYEPSRVLAEIPRYRVSFVYMVPTMIQHLLAEDDGAADVSSLRMFLYGSAPMPVPVLRKARERYGDIFYQVYTLSESPVITTLMRPAEHEDVPTSVAPTRLASVGRELLTMELKLIDDEGHEIEPGQVGEIAVRSVNNMAEYWHLPEQTSTTLVDGWILTGDMGQRDEDGYLYIVDRKKDIIITGAFNVYPKEVEDILYKHPAVAQAGVVGVPDEEWGEAIKAYVVLKPGQSTDAQTLMDFCRENMSSYKKPRLVEFVDSLPLTPIGKLSRQGLRELAKAGT